MYKIVVFVPRLLSLIFVIKILVYERILKLRKVVKINIDGKNMIEEKNIFRKSEQIKTLLLSLFQLRLISIVFFLFSSPYIFLRWSFDFFLE